MSIGTGRTVVAVCVLSGSLLLLGAGPDMMAQSRPGEKPSGGGTTEGASVLVEAFVVEVNLPALARQGVSPIGAQPHAVTVADILQCLGNNQARVLGGTRISAQAGTKVTAQTKRTTYIGGARAPGYRSYDSGETLSVLLEPASGTTVSIDFNFSSTRFTQEQAAPVLPPGRESWDWSGRIVLDLGEPQIVGAGQDGETAVFLLLTANTPK